MNLDKQYKIFKMMNTIKKLNKTLWLLHYLVPLFHLFCIIFFMLLNILPQIAISFDIVSQILIAIKDNYLTIDLANVYFIVGILISFFLIVLGFLRLRVMPNYDQLSQHKKLQKILFISTVALGYAYEIGIFFFAWSFSQIYDHEGLILAILKCFIPLAGYMYFSKKYSTNSLYGWFIIPITILIITVDNPVSYIIVILISFYLLIQQKSLLKKIFYGFVALVALFVMKNSQLFQQSGTAQMQISFICLGILAVLTPIFIIHIKEKLDISNSQQKIQNCYTILHQLKADSPYSQMKFQDFYELYNTIVTFSLSNKDQKSNEIDLILQKEPQKISKRQFLFLLQKFLEKQCRNASQSNILKQIYLFKIKAELEYSPYSIIQDLYNLNEQMQRGHNKVYQEQIFQIFDQIIGKYAIIKNGYLQPAYLIHLNKLHEDFQNKVNLMLDRFQNFWRQIAQDQIKLLALDSCFEEVLEVQNNIEQLYMNINKFGYFEREKKIIDITRSLYNVYQEVNKYSREGKKKIESSDKDVTHAFVILENGAIKFISKDFMKSLRKKGTLSYENIDKKILFGKDFSMIIDQLTKNLSASSQIQYQSVPVLTQSGVMQLKKIRIMWYPSLQVKSRIIITFSEDMQLAHEAYLIYHMKSDTIKYFNSKFIKTFKIDQQRFLDQIENNQLFFNELFVQTDVHAEQIKKYLKEETTIKCKIYLKNFIERGMIPSIPVQVNVLRCIYVNKQPTHCILKVSKIKQKHDNIVVDPMTENNLQRRQFYQQKQVVSKAQSALERKWADQKFFCKIPNHYESKISQKQAKLEEKNRWVFRYYIHSLFSFAFLTIMILWIMDNNFLATRIKGYRKEFTAVMNTSEQYTLMYQIFSCIVKDYYIKKHPQQTQMVRNMSASFLNNYYKTSQQKFLDQFMQLFLTQFNEPSNNELDYKIDFDQFSINTTTKLPTLLDFVENAKKHIANSQYQFMLKNYNNYRDLTIKFQTSTKSQQTILAIIQEYKKYYWILITITSVCMISILLFLVKIQSSIKTVYSLIERIPTSQLKQNLLAFQIRKQRILDIFFLSNADLIKKKALAMKSASNTKTGSMTSFNSDISYNTNELNEDLTYFLDNQYTTGELKKTKQLQSFKQVTQSIQSHHEQDALLNKQKNGKPIQKQQTSRMIQESFIAKLYRKSLFIFLLFVFNGIFILNYMDLMKQKEGMMEILKIQKTFYTNLISVKRVTIDSPIRAVMQDYFNQTVPSYFSSEINLLASLPNKMILNQMDDFAQKAQQALQQSMCKYGTQYVGTVAMCKPCQTYLNGIVTQGFRQTYDLFMSNAKMLSQQSLAEFGTFPCTPEKCPPYFENQFVTLLLGQTSRYMINLLQISVREAFMKMQKNLKIQTALKIIGLIIVAIVYYIFDERLKNRCRKAIQYFRIIPKKIMCSIRMTSFIRKNNILSKLQIL